MPTPERRDHSDRLVERGAAPAAALLDSVERPGATFLVGPPGSGKTTLLQYVADVLREKNERPVFVFHRGSYAIQRGQVDIRAAVPGTYVIVDDADELSAGDIMQLLLSAATSTAHIVMAGSNLLADRMKDNSVFSFKTVSLDGWTVSDLIALLEIRVGNALPKDVITRIAHETHSPRDAVTAAAEFMMTSAVALPSPAAPADRLAIIIDPGDATADDLARLLSSISEIYRAFGGSGLVFNPDGTDIYIRSGASA